MAYYGTYQGILDELDGTLPSTYWSQAAIEGRLLPLVTGIIDSELGGYYEVPFTDATKHAKGVPTYINYVANIVAKSKLQAQTQGDKQPRKSSTYDILLKQIREMLQRIKIKDSSDFQELVYSDGTIVPRITTMPRPPIKTPTELVVSNWTGINDDGVDDSTYYEPD